MLGFFLFNQITSLYIFHLQDFGLTETNAVLVVVLFYTLNLYFDISLPVRRTCNILLDI